MVNALNSNTVKKAISRFVLYVVIIAGAVCVSVPFIWMVSSSLKKDNQIFTFPPQWIPKPVMWNNYIDALTSYLPFPIFFKNTVLITFIAMIGELISCSLVGYGFARLRFPGRDKLFICVLGTMMVPFHVVVIPNFILFNRLNWINTFLPLTVPAYFAGNAFYIFLFRQFFRGIPKGLDDAARIDGCGTWGIWLKIIIPNSKPVFASTAIFSFQAHWNEFLRPLIYLNTESNFTLTIGMNMLKSAEGSKWNWMMAVAVLAMLPPLLLFFFFQKIFIQGVVVSGIKG